MKPVGCGIIKGPREVESWQAAHGRAPGEAPDGTGLSLVTAPRVEFACRPFTFECWLIWPGGNKPLRRLDAIAEAAGNGWRWRFGFDHAGALTFVWRAGDAEKAVHSEMMADALHSGVWYHVALTVTGDRCGMSLTEAGSPLLRWSSGLLYFSPPGKLSAGETATLAIGRSVDMASAPEFHIGSAAWHAAQLELADFVSLGAPPPDGICVDTDFPAGSLGRLVALGKDLFSFSARTEDAPWFAFRMRGVQDRQLRFLRFPDAMGLSIFVSEDGNMNRFWGVPGGPPTIKALEHFLRTEAERTGGLILLDWHAGTIWRGHAMVGFTKAGYSDPALGDRKLHVRRHESLYPEFERCLP